MEQTMIDVEMMEASDTWPLHPYLPLTHKSEDNKLGFLFAGQGARVYLGNVFTDRPDLPSVRYSSFEVAAEIWKVD